MRIGLGINNDALVVAAKGDALVVMLSEPPGQVATWSIDVWAELDGRASAAGRGHGVKPVAYVGTINTTAVLAGFQQTRIVGQAVCAGARAWILRATGPAPGFTGGGGSPIDAWAEIDASPSACCGFTTGVYYPNGSARIVTTGGPLVSSRIDFTSPTKILSVFGYLPKVGEGGNTDFIMVFDSATLPANGTQPTKGLSVLVTTDSNYDLSFNVPLAFQNGLCVALSSTPDTLTLAADTCRIVTRTQW